MSKRAAPSPLRKQFGRQLRQTRRVLDITQDQIALLFYALKIMRFYFTPEVQREHALLSASLLADCLGVYK